jgi:hypothetical protein
VDSVTFSLDSLRLAPEVTAELLVRNPGQRALGPVVLITGPLRNESGSAAIGLQIITSPAEISTLNPGSGRQIVVSVTAPEGVPIATYSGALEARLPNGVSLATLPIVVEISFARNDRPVGDVRITEGPRVVRQGDVGRYLVEVTAPDGGIVSGANVKWSLSPASAGLMRDDGRFVGYELGRTLLIARVGQAADTLEITIAPRVGGDSGRQ